MGLDVLLDRCATGDPLVRCPRKLLTKCVCTHGRTLVAFSFISATHPGGYGYLLRELHMALSGHVAARGRGEERESRECARCIVRACSTFEEYGM